jgi:ribosomal protein S18 acetylase RimI-like enzyme
MSCREQAHAFWQTNRLRYLVPLKYTHLYCDVVRCDCDAQGDSVGILLHYATHDIFWDAGMYPTAQHVLIPTAADEQAAQRLCQRVQEQFPASHLVIKFSEAYTRAVFQAAFTLHYARTLVSYTAPHIADVSQSPYQWERDAAVRLTQTPDEAIMRLYLANGYSREEIQHSFANGAVAFTLYQQGEPVCTCMAYQNFDDIWEIGGVHTLAQAQRQGYARRVVQTALAALADQQRIPRYLVDATNTASVQLAESLGLAVCLRFEHYVTQD